MYHEDGFWDGAMTAAGGFGVREFGAAGTVFVERRGLAPLRTLTLDNGGHSPSSGRVNQVGLSDSYTDVNKHLSLYSLLKWTDQFDNRKLF